MAFATGKLIIVLPLLIEKTEQLFERLRLNHEEDAVPAVDVLYPVAYSFPHVGKLLGILFIPFAAWFLGNALAWSEYPPLLVSGVFAYFGGPDLGDAVLARSNAPAARHVSAVSAVRRHRRAIRRRVGRDALGGRSRC